MCVLLVTEEALQPSTGRLFSNQVSELNGCFSLGAFDAQKGEYGPEHCRRLLVPGHPAVPVPSASTVRIVVSVDLAAERLLEEITRLQLESFAREKMRLGEGWTCEGVDFCFGEVYAGFELEATAGQHYNTHLNFYASRADFETWLGQELPGYLDGYLDDEPLWESTNP